MTEWWKNSLGAGLGFATAGSVMLLFRGPGHWLIGADPRARVLEFGVGLAVTGTVIVTGFATDAPIIVLTVAAALWMAVEIRTSDRRAVGAAAGHVCDMADVRRFWPLRRRQRL